LSNEREGKRRRFYVLSRSREKTNNLGGLKDKSQQKDVTPEGRKKGSIVQRRRTRPVLALVSRGQTTPRGEEHFPGQKKRSLHKKEKKPEKRGQITSHDVVTGPPTAKQGTPGARKKRNARRYL